MSIRANAIKPTEEIGVSLPGNLLCDFSDQYKGDGLATIYSSDSGSVGFITANKTFLLDFAKEHPDWKEEVDKLVKDNDEFIFECY